MILVWGAGARDQQAWQVLALGVAFTVAASVTPPDLGGSVYEVSAGYTGVVFADAGSLTQYEVHAGYRAVVQVDGGLS